mmetsp:Transcript_31708/g.48568  ORF Transcript_31708/g.48568 Transcript_31708/m.48568 type:complete len:118 (-) Transcript_31708:49-402(-)
MQGVFTILGYGTTFLIAFKVLGEVFSKLYVDLDGSSATPSLVDNLGGWPLVIQYSLILVQAVLMILGLVVDVILAYLEEEFMRKWDDHHPLYNYHGSLEDEYADGLDDEYPDEDSSE